MKAFLLAVVIIGASISANTELTEQQKKIITSFVTTCVDETGVDTELIKKANEGTFGDDPKLKAFALCMSNLFGFQDADGKIQTEFVRTKLLAVIKEAEAANQTVETCLKEKARSIDTAAEGFKCFFMNSPIHLSALLAA